jgi:hypothetical protein
MQTKRILRIAMVLAGVVITADGGSSRGAELCSLLYPGRILGRAA